MHYHLVTYITKFSSTIKWLHLYVGTQTSTCTCVLVTDFCKEGDPLKVELRSSNYMHVWVYYSSAVLSNIFCKTRILSRQSLLSLFTDPVVICHRYWGDFEKKMIRKVATRLALLITSVTCTWCKCVIQRDALSLVKIFFFKKMNLKLKLHIRISSIH